MIEELLQLWLDQALATRTQRWVLGVAAVGSITVASTLAAVGAGSITGHLTVVAMTTALATIAVAGSGAHTGSIVIAAVAFEWLAFVDDITNARAIGVASCVYAFHALLALMAATPHTSVIDPRVLGRWAARSLYVIAATVAVWAMVVAFERRNASGDESLTIAGLVVIAAAIMALRRGILTQGRELG